MPPSRVLTDQDQHELLQSLIEVARKAGEVMQTGSTHMLTASANIAQKASAVDLVTEWDVKTEDLIRTELEKAWPGFGFIGEESYTDETKLTNEPTFCVDPIDGTTNFIHSFPFACVSIGVLYEKQPIIGVVFNPFLNQLYSGRVGHGSFLNETRRLPLYPPRPLTSLSEALVGIEWGSKRTGPAIEAKIASFKALAAQEGKMVHGLRSMGSAALNYCLVASGSLDIYWEIGCWPWDISAGAIIAQEAGGFVSGAPNSPHDGVIDEKLLTGRKYIVVRAVAGSESESSLQCQQRLVKDFLATVVDYEP
ncbi:inositol monophosphatase [Auriculariales sp. MPI-PUGE-AT-0066]|nr:inositol monophosphatase [Auriculariales sp. MPI-PUGE-AT-0066]